MFVLTQDKVTLNVHISAISAGVSIGCCLLILLLSLWVYSVRSARQHLDRVSFRLLLWSMVFEIIYDVNYIASVIVSRTADVGCSVGIYFMIGTLGVVNYLCTAIAVNLMLTIVVGLNPVMLKLERWYVGVSIFVGLFVPIVPAALGHFGWDPLLNVCWIRADTDKARMRNFILDLYLWQILSCIIATVSVAATLIKLFRQGRATSRALFDGNSINLEMSAESHEINLKPKQRSFLARILRRRRQSHDRENMFGHLEDKFVGIALRISLYPITLIIVNGLITIGDLYFSASGGVKNQATYGLYCVYYFLYGGRGIFFAALGLFVDPCIGRGLKAIWKTKYSKEAREAHREMEPKVALGSDELPVIHTPLSSRVDPLNIAHEAGPNGSLVERAQRTLNGGELGTNNSMGLTQLERQNSAASLDMLTALFMSDPDDYHDHWTQEFHAESGDAGLRKKRASRRAHSLPTPRFHIPRLFGRRKSEMVTAGSGDCDPSPKPTPDDSQAAGPTPVPSDGPPTPIHEMPTPPGFSMTFAGVPTDALPDIMDDHAHDVVLPEALEAAQAAAASHSATPTPRLGSIRSGLQSGLTSGQRTPMGGTPPVRRGSLAESSGVLGRRGSMIEAYSARRGSVAAPPGSLRSSINNGRPGPRRGATLPPGLHLRDSLESPRSPRDDRRVRRERALEIAEKLYEEMEAQL